MLMVFKNIISYIKYIVLCVSYNVRCSVSNKKSFAIQAAAMFINNFVFILFWAVLFANKGGNINGTTMQDIIYLWSVPVMAYGICYFCFGGVNTLCSDIVEGNIDMYLTRPKHSLISILTARSELSAMGDFLSGFVCGLIAVSFNPIKFLRLLILSVMSAIIILAIITIIDMMTFWIGDMTNLSKRYVNSLLITLTIYPERMFPKVVKYAMYSVIPAAYIAHIPIRIAKGEGIIWFIILAVAFFVFTFFMFYIYEKGLKRYESGNGITRR